MHSSEFAELRAFVAVAERNNFARGAAHLGLVPSTISQTIKSLEERLGVRLFNRTTRSVSLTEAGERLLARVRPAVMELDAAVGDLDRFRDTPTGTLRLSVSTIAMQIVLAPAMKAFLAAFPGITLDVTVDDNQDDTIGGRFDADIRIGQRVTKDMQMLRITEPSRAIAVASPLYLAGHPAPSTPADLPGHACIRLRKGSQPVAWEFERGRNRVEISVNGPLIVNTMESMINATLDGIGIGYTIEAHVSDHIAAGRLVPLLKDWSRVQHSYYLQYSARGQIPIPLKALIGFFGKRQDKSGAVQGRDTIHARRPPEVLDPDRDNQSRV